MVIFRLFFRGVLPKIIFLKMKGKSDQIFFRSDVIIILSLLFYKIFFYKLCFYYFECKV